MGIILSSGLLGFSKKPQIKNFKNSLDEWIGSLYRVRVISLDVTGTLVDGRPIKHFWDALIPAAYARKHRISFKEAFSHVKQAYETISRDDVEWYLPEYWMRRLNIGDGVKELFEELRQMITFFPDVESTIVKLSSNYNMIVSSNLPIRLIEVILDDFKKYFSKLFSSVSTYSLPYKTAEFYSKVCSDTGFKPEEILHIGDNTLYDFVIPRLVGMRSILVKRYKRLIGDHEVSSLKQVLDKITGIDI
jgi:putative hydrolase of the HAD superfamily